jgi:DNA-binding XRE family transcriptional regulator
MIKSRGDSHFWDRRAGVVKIYRYNGKCNISGVIIRDKRERAGFSQEQLAAKLQLEGVNLNQKAISRIETGERVVADYELRTLAKVLCVSVYTLLHME